MNKIEIIDNLPDCDIGAPSPTVLASEHTVVLSYRTDQETICQIIFSHCFEFRMGMPDENLLEKHPLGPFGLKNYYFQQVKDSSWIEEIESRYHTISDYSRDGRIYEHYIFTFHDRSFECVSAGYKVKESDKTKIKDSIIDSMNEI